MLTTLFHVQPILRRTPSTIYSVFWFFREKSVLPMYLSPNSKFGLVSSSVPESLNHFFDFELGYIFLWNKKISFLNLHHQYVVKSQYNTTFTTYIQYVETQQQYQYIALRISDYIMQGLGLSLYGQLKTILQYHQYTFFTIHGRQEELLRMLKSPSHFNNKF